MQTSSLGKVTGSLTNDRSLRKSKPLALEIGITVLMLGLLLPASIAVNRLSGGASSSGASGQQVGLTFFEALLIGVLPIVALPMLSLLERLLPAAGQRKSLSTWFLNLRIAIFYVPAAAFAGALGGELSSILRHHVRFGLIDLRFVGGKGIIGLVGAFLVFRFVSDFFFYWYHRTMHKVPFLWQIHKLHHMDEQLDVLTGGRDNWLDAIVVTFLINIPMTLFFQVNHLSPVELGLTSGVLMGVFGLVVDYSIHANVRWHYGKATAIFCGPQVHRIHHSRLPQHRDKNFCRSFPIWDILFGTYYAPERGEFPPSGVEGEPEISSLVEAQIFTFREWRKMLRGRRLRRDLVSK